MPDDRCESVHKWSAERCIRASGHDGPCYGKAHVRRDIGTITRTEWLSKDGQFDMHLDYHTIVPRNLNRS